MVALPLLRCLINFKIDFKVDLALHVIIKIKTFIMDRDALKGEK
jgi:hypothetical protein